VTRILFDTSSLDDRPSGAKSRLERLVPALEARGHHVTLAIVPARRGVLRRVLQPKALAAAVRRARPDVVVFETWPAPRVGVPSIAVVHDLRHVRAGGLRRTFALRWLRDGAARARRVHAVSETVRAELSALVPGAADRVDVVPNAVIRTDPAPDAPSALEILPEGIGPFVFAAGHAEPRKGWRLVGAVAERLAASGIVVVRAGRGHARVPGVLDLGVVSEEERDALFRSAVAVLAPSSLEGFGLVPLEALAQGAWVVASAIEAHREVLGDAASFFEPLDADGAVAAIVGASQAAPDQREARAARGRARAAAWSPGRAADAFEASLRAAGLSSRSAGSR
jgi:glycosyltransferase involved in cell wall biosynthesis